MIDQERRCLARFASLTKKQLLAACKTLARKRAGPGNAATSKALRTPAWGDSRAASTYWTSRRRTKRWTAKPAARRPLEPQPRGKPPRLGRGEAAPGQAQHPGAGTTPPTNAALPKHAVDARRGRGRRRRGREQPTEARPLRAPLQEGAESRRRKNALALTTEEEETKSKRLRAPRAESRALATISKRTGRIDDSDVH